MDSELTPVRTSLTYTISVQGPEGWIPVRHWECFEEALESLDFMVRVRPEDAFRLIEREIVANGFSVNVVDEYFPDGHVYGPENEPISWAEEGF